jgi:diphosphomevalonate decarboxylase
MLAKDVVNKLLGDKVYQPIKQQGDAYAPSNIALIKYWGKRNQDLHLPFNSSVSVSLGDKGAKTSIKVIEADQHLVILNGKTVSQGSGFYLNIQAYLDLFKAHLPYVFEIQTISTVPIAAGVASSACGFAALLSAIDDLFGFGVSKNQLSILARLGSGSASRSLWNGFVQWDKGVEDDGMDSFARPLDIMWPEFMIGLWCFDKGEKPVSSREGMQRTVETSQLYKAWPELAESACEEMCGFIKAKDFRSVGMLAEANALMMHKTMHDAKPAVNYWQQTSVSAMDQVRQARQQGLDVYFTMDAGPNLKLLGQQKDLEKLKESFPAVDWVLPLVD